MADYGGMRPTFRYSSEDDPKIQQFNKALQALQIFGGFISQERATEQKRKDSILSAEIGQLQNLGLNVNIEEYFDDPNYRNLLQSKKDDKRNVANKAFDFKPDDDFKVLSPTLLSYKSVFDTDISPSVFEGADLAVARQILIEGDKEINEPAIMNLTWNEINAFPGMSDELMRLGLLQTGEANAAEWEEARLKIPERFEWFSISVKSGTDAMGLSRNPHFAVNETEINKIVSDKMALAAQRLNLVKEEPAYIKYKEASDKWDAEKDSLIGRRFDKDENLFFAEGAKGTQEWDDWKQDNQFTASILGLSIDQLASDAVSENAAVRNQWNKLDEQLQAESNARKDTFYLQLKTRINQFNKGLQLFRGVHRGAEVYDTMALEERAKINVEDMEDMNDVITPISQQVAYLRAIQTGKLPLSIDSIERKYLIFDDSGAITGTNNELVKTDMVNAIKSFTEFEQSITALYQANQTQISPLHVRAQFDESVNKHAQFIIQTPSELRIRKEDEDRDAYMDAIFALEYENLWRGK